MKKIIIHTEASVNARGNFNSKHCKPIMCLKADGSELHSFTSVTDAAKELGIAANYISTCMNNGTLCKGYEVFSTQDAPAHMGKIMQCFNHNANDASNYRRIKAEEDAVRKAKEHRAALVAKAEAKVAKCASACAKYQDKLNESMQALDEANNALEALLNQEK